MFKLFQVDVHVIVNKFKRTKQEYAIVYKIIVKK